MSDCNYSDMSKGQTSSGAAAMQICFRIDSGRDFTLDFQPHQTLCDILSRTIYDSKNFCVTHNGKILLWYFPLSEQNIKPTNNYIECKIHAKTTKTRKVCDRADLSNFESLYDSDPDVFLNSSNGCLDCNTTSEIFCDGNYSYGCYSDYQIGNCRIDRQSRSFAVDDDKRNEKKIRKREYQRKRYANMSLEDKQMRLEQMKAYERAKRARETLAEREARLMRLRINQHRRIDIESEPDRSRRLQRLQKNQRHRIHTEDADGRHKRLIRMKENARMRVERRKAIAQILGSSCKKGRKKTSTAELLMRQAGDNLTFMKMNSKNMSGRNQGFPSMEQQGQKDPNDRQDDFSYLSQNDKNVCNTQDGSGFANQCDKNNRQGDLSYLDSSQKNSNGEYSYMKENNSQCQNRNQQGGHKAGMERGSAGGAVLPCMDSTMDKDGLNKQGLADKADTSGIFSHLHSNQNKDMTDKEMGFDCLTSPQSNISEENGKTGTNERDGGFSYISAAQGLGLSDRDGAFPYLKPNYKPTQVDCVRTEIMTPRSEDLLNLDAIQSSLDPSSKGTAAKAGQSDQSNNLTLLDIGGQQKTDNSSCSFTSPKTVKRKKKKSTLGPGEAGADFGQLEDVGTLERKLEYMLGSSFSPLISQDYYDNTTAEMMTPKDRKLLKMRLKQRRRLHTETDAQRTKRLMRMKRYQHQRMANEPPEQRQRRLVRMRENARRREERKKAVAQILGNTQKGKKKSQAISILMRRMKDNENILQYQSILNRDSGSFPMKLSSKNMDKNCGYMCQNDKSCSSMQNSPCCSDQCGKSCQQENLCCNGDFPCMKENGRQCQSRSHSNGTSAGSYSCMEPLSTNKDVMDRSSTGEVVFPSFNQIQNQVTTNGDGNSFGCYSSDQNKSMSNSMSDCSYMNNCNMGKDGCYANMKCSQDCKKRKKGCDCLSTPPMSSIDEDCYECASNMMCGPNCDQGSKSNGNQFSGGCINPREKRLEQMRQYQRRRLETESLDERQKRLERMRMNSKMRVERKRIMVQMMKTGQKPRGKGSTMVEQDSLLRYTDTCGPDGNVDSFCIDQMKSKDDRLQTPKPNPNEEQSPDFAYVGSNQKAVTNRQSDYLYSKSNMSSENHGKTMSDRDSVFMSRNQVNKIVPERGSVFPCMDQIADKNELDRAGLGGPVFPGMTLIPNKDTHDKGPVFPCMDQEQNKNLPADRGVTGAGAGADVSAATAAATGGGGGGGATTSGGSSGMAAGSFCLNPYQTEVPSADRASMFPYGVQSQNKDPNDKAGGVIHPFFNQNQSRNLNDRDINFPCIIPEQNRMSNFSYMNPYHGVPGSNIDRDGNCSYLKSVPDVRKKTDHGHRKKEVESSSSAFSSSVVNYGKSADAGMQMYSKQSLGYMCISCERPLPRDQLSRFSPFPGSLIPDHDPNKLADEQKQWICKTCEKLKRNYHLFPNPVS
ncbi:uncharacterized protein LOC115221555 [Octopus sinensis]|uniref:Uncharacterized protein LOC115221555 n=1 Tax=Octopus sinensis TaxID=2607531 RepID=A0A6P7TBA0_9MOLL|nr:uncharacterized protein LOC115221555 [Octopus sinensis]